MTGTWGAGNVRAVICSALCIISTKGLRRRLLVEQRQLARRFLSSVSVGRAFTISLPCPALSHTGYSLLLPFYLALILMLCCGLFSVFAIVQGPMLQEAVPTGYRGGVSFQKFMADAYSSRQPLLPNRA
ncbi:hypothetical protein V2K57_06175 [Pseudomonas alliivorans]|nr:hypothetical protein [Pseudomonas alliivorans]MEE4699987.1 hypothetical protein [Pseudomonas alliivorans]MEE4735966.1 hypothetical protein [Pseudomonas alliivorans]